MKSLLAISILGAPLISLLVTASNVPSPSKESLHPTVRDASVQLGSVILNLRTPIASPGGRHSGDGSGTTSGDEAPQEDGQHRQKDPEKESQGKKEDPKKLDRPEKPYRDNSPADCQEADSRNTAKQANDRATATPCPTKSRVPAATAHAGSVTFAATSLTGGAVPSETPAERNIRTGQTGAAEVVRPRCIIFATMPLLTLMGGYIFAMGY
ncbi:hypothetical protein DM02DRAFT_674914 [Periconia macrospinosa]|uniref:Uncharacterized protein n=1 Tax=Periconia macrospinosa TaxID=97972 RepID=A0A2V1DFE7_9PLEO|nr:hypothetical protein DM02DRAFT_674914 [Periconia macrospinosa]